MALLVAALELPLPKALRRWTYHCLFSLNAMAGLRHSEVLNLCCNDVGLLDQGVLTIRQSKFGGRVAGPTQGRKPPDAVAEGQPRVGLATRPQ